MRATRSPLPLPVPRAQGGGTIQSQQPQPRLLSFPPLKKKICTVNTVPTATASTVEFSAAGQTNKSLKSAPVTHGYILNITYACT